MKIEANVEFVIDDSALNIRSGEIVHVDVDADYVEDNGASVIEWVTTELESRYGMTFDYDSEFIITNLNDIVDDLKMDEFEEKTEGCRM